MRKVCQWMVLSMLVVLVSTPVSAQDFFKGKTIRLVVGYTPGGGFDTFSRLVARHLGKFIPGNPSVIVQNMPGAGSLAAANRVYAMQPGNGLVIVVFHYSLVSQAITGDPVVKFDPSQYIYLGDPTIGALPQILYLRTDLGINNLAELGKVKKPVTLGMTGVGSSASVAGRFLETLGLPIKNVYGYRGSARAMAAVERKEVDGRVTSQATMEGIYKRFLENGWVKPIVSIGDEPRHKPLQGVATVKDLNLNAEQKQMTAFLQDAWKFLRIFAVPPGTPADRVAVLREAFIKAGQSKELREDADRQGIIVDPVSGEEIAKSVMQLKQTPKPIIEKYKKLLGPAE